MPQIYSKINQETSEQVIQSDKMDIEIPPNPPPEQIENIFENVMPFSPSNFGEESENLALQISSPTPSPLSPNPISNVEIPQVPKSFSTLTIGKKINICWRLYDYLEKMTQSLFQVQLTEILKLILQSYRARELFGTVLTHKKILSNFQLTLVYERDSFLIQSTREDNSISYSAYSELLVNGNLKDVLPSKASLEKVTNECNLLIKQFLSITSSSKQNKEILVYSYMSLIKWIPLMLLLVKNLEDTELKIKLNIDGSPFGKRQIISCVAIVMNSKVKQHSYVNTFPLYFVRAPESNRGI